MHSEPGELLEHMANDRDVDLDEFATAWMVALVLHGFGDKLKPGFVNEALDRAQQLRRRPRRRHNPEKFNIDDDIPF